MSIGIVLMRARRRWTAAAGLLGLTIGLWLSLIPYRYEVSIGRMDVAGRCPSAVIAAFTRVPDNPFYDLGPGERLPAALCARSARGRLAGGTALCLLASAIVVAGRTTWRWPCLRR